MQMKEKLIWIYDSVKRKGQAEWDPNVALVHSLGLKCDCVGWCEIVLDENTSGLLGEIAALAAENQSAVRGIYERELTTCDGGWYLIKKKHLQCEYEDELEDFTDSDGESLTPRKIKAYKIPKTEPVIAETPLPLVNEKFKNTCDKHGLTGLKFYWTRDTGRYKAAQFFAPMPENMVSEFGGEEGLSYHHKLMRLHSNPVFKESDPLYKKYRALGGYLPELSGIFYDLLVYLPYAFRTSLLPPTDFAYIFNGRFGELLIREHAAQLLLKDGALRREHLVPVIAAESYPAGYTVEKSRNIAFPDSKSLKKINSLYLTFLQKEKPVRAVSEKEALSLLRHFKKNNPENFQKSLSAAARSPLADTPFAPLLPYYKISSEILLNDETTLLAYTDALKETEEYADELQKEELLSEKIEGIVIAKAIDGDYFILKDGAVYRISHEDMSVCGSWPTLPDFIGETLIEE